MFGAGMSQFGTEYESKTAVVDKDEWRTPDWLFSALDGVFHFELDAAATFENAKCPFYYDIGGLDMRWDTPAFCNPPFSNGQYGDWIEKAADELINHGTTTVMILPFNAETEAFRPVWEAASYLIVPYKRINFDDPQGNRVSGANFLVCIAVFTSDYYDMDKLVQIGWVLDLNLGLINNRVARAS
jgi:phage N-6-adenine-methyltransferase